MREPEGAVTYPPRPPSLCPSKQRSRPGKGETVLVDETRSDEQSSPQADRELDCRSLLPRGRHSDPF